MPRAGITFDQVAAEAERLIHEGQRPTVRNVRDGLGGSPNTIQRHLAVWRDSRPADSSSAAELPAALAAALVAEIERAAAAAREDVEEQLRLAQADTADLAAAGEALEQENESLLSQLAEVASDRDRHAGKAQQLMEAQSDQLQRLESERKAAETARAELSAALFKLESATARVAEQKAEITTLRSSLEEERKSRAAAEHEVASLSAKLDAANDRILRAESRNDATEVELRKAERELSTARVQVQAQQAGLDAAARELESAKSSASESRTEARRARDEAAELRGKLATLLSQAPKSGKDGIVR